MNERCTVDEAPRLRPIIVRNTFAAIAAHRIDVLDIRELAAVDHTVKES